MLFAKEPLIQVLVKVMSCFALFLFASVSFIKNLKIDYVSSCVREHALRKLMAEFHGRSKVAKAFLETTQRKA